MARIVVEIPGERAYDVVVSAGQIDRLGAEMRAFDTNQKALIITDTEVAERYLDPAKASLKQVGYQVSVITVPAGESAKSVECASEIWHAMVEWWAPFANRRWFVPMSPRLPRFPKGNGLVGAVK